MKKKIKRVIIILLAITIIPLLFFKRGEASEYLPVATPDNADFLELSDGDFGIVDFFDFGFLSEIEEGSSSLGSLGKLTFNMKFEVSYIQAYIQAYQNGDVTLENFTTEQIIMINQLYEVVWIHLILQFICSIWIGAGAYKFIKGSLN